MGDPLEGGGIADTIWKAGADIVEGRTEDFTMDGIALGLDALGFMANPLGALASAGVGMLIEHLDFLREPLDDLAGDPGAITQLALTWGEDVKSEVARVADDVQRAAREQTASWEGEAADAYRKMADNLSEHVRSLEGAASGVAEGIQGSGALVATVRGIIRDLIADVVGEILVAAAAAIASSWFTLGGSIGAFIGWAVARGAATAGKIAGKISKLLTKLANILSRFSNLRGAVQALGKLAQKFKNIAKQLGRAAGARGAAVRTTEAASEAARRGLKEAIGGRLPQGLRDVGDNVDDVMGKMNPRQGYAGVDSLNPDGLARTAVYEAAKEGTQADDSYDEALDERKDGSPRSN